jgi:hypothetical protein
MEGGPLMEGRKEEVFWSTDCLRLIFCFSFWASLLFKGLSLEPLIPEFRVE